MKYILLMNAPKAGFEEYRKWSKSDVESHYAVLQRINKELTASGEFVATAGLGWPGEAVIVRSGNDGAPETDGIFAESKEFLAGYWIVDVETPQRAYEIAAKISGAPGPGGMPLSMPIEVRQVMSRAPEEFV